jgi:hypothetical protein
MSRIAFCWIAGVAAIASWGLPEPGPWRRIPLPGDPGMVSVLAAGQAGTALGTSRGGVLVLDTGFALRARLTDALFGEERRIHDLAWSGNRLWIAAETGLFACDSGSGSLDRTRKDVPDALRSGVRALAVAENGLWAATSASVAYFQPGRADSYRSWNTPVSDPPTAVKCVGGRVLLGTSSKGLFLLDTASGGWVGFSRAEGLSSEQVTGLEWVGDEVFVATPEGLDALDLSTRKVRGVLPNAIVSWMTQVNGTLFLQTPEGLLRLGRSSGKAVGESLPGSGSGDALEFLGGKLLVASGAELFVRSQPTLLGEEPLRLAPEGFRIDLPRPAGSKPAVQAWLRIPEWPQAKTLLSTQLLDDGRRLLVHPPAGTRGLVQIDLVVGDEANPDEIRSLEGAFVRDKPSLKIDPVRPVVRDEFTEISGRAAGVAPLNLSLFPTGTQIPVDSVGRFRTKIRLARGSNSLELVLTNAMGNQVSRSVVVRRDDRPPVFEPSADDTVAGDFARVRIAYRDEGSVVGSVRGAAPSRLSVFDSFVVVESFKLAVGLNSVRLSLEDEAGNIASRTVRIFRKPPPEGFQSSIWRLGRLADFSDTGGAPTKMSGGEPVYLLHYNMLEGETLCGVAQRFYGSQNLAPILIRWNGFADSSQWRKMPVGTPVDVPVWRNLDHTNPDVKALLDGFPWDRVPSRARTVP